VRDGECAPRSTADCAASAMCRERGRCVARGGACALPCRLTAECAERGHCVDGPDGCTNE
jgi:hypothetical protein